jgi:hypothetical protein
MRYDARVDENQPAIIEAARNFGASVTLLYRLGHNVPDILVGYNGVDQQIEIKSAVGGLTDGQCVYFKEWQGRPVRVVRSVHEMITLLLTMGNK